MEKYLISKWHVFVSSYIAMQFIPEQAEIYVAIKDTNNSVV